MARRTASAAQCAPVDRKCTIAETLLRTYCFTLYVYWEIRSRHENCFSGNFISVGIHLCISVTGKYLVQTHLCVLVKRCSDFGSTSWQEIRSRHEEGCEYIRLPKGDNIEEDML